MAHDAIYIHLESISNLIWSEGLLATDFVAGLKTIPRHIILLSPTDPAEQVDRQTGFNVLSTPEDVASFLSDRRIKQPKWVDYERTQYLNLMSPNEVAELLYLAHAYRNLSSPFYYKLQNNFVYLTLPDNSVKVFYRDLTQFYHVLNVGINRILQEQRRMSWGLFRGINRPKINDIPDNLIHQMVPLFIDGINLTFKQINFSADDWHIQIYQQANPIGNRESSNPIPNKPAIGKLIYHQQNGNWQLEVAPAEQATYTDFL